MNINMNAFLAPLQHVSNFPGFEGDVLSDEIAEHREILSRSFALTGRVAFVPDPEDWEAGAMQVWSEMTDAKWMWVSPAGEVVYSECPLHGDQSPE